MCKMSLNVCTEYLCFSLVYLLCQMVQSLGFILHTICCCFPSDVGEEEVCSGTKRLLPVVNAPCVCVMLVVCVPDEEESLAAPVSREAQNFEER